MKIFGLVFSLLLAASALAVFPQNQAAAADLVILNANVRTMDKKQPRAEAFAVAGNKILAVGTNKQISRLIRQNTKTIDAKGWLALPGFNDSHVHFTAIGNQFSSMDLRQAKTLAEAVEKIKYYTEFLPDEQWILGSGWKFENPTKDMVDAATPAHPVFLYNSDGRRALANSLALRLAGIDRNSKLNGVGRDAASGEPNGVLENAAMARVRSVVPNKVDRNWAEIIETASNYAASLGITSVQDVHSDDLFETYRQLYSAGKLKTRVYDCINLFEWKKLADAKIQKASGDAFVRRGCLKSFSDGNREAEPEIYQTILAGDKAGLQVMMHAIGNQANDLVLSVYERVTKENGALRDRRFRVEHAHDFRDKDLPRFARSKIIASLQPYLFYGNEPYRDLLASGALLAFGSDASMTDFNPLLGIYAATSDDLTDTQAISVEEAVRAYTYGSAYAEFQENVKGSLEAGKLADFVLLSEDIFAIKPENIRGVKVLLTVVDGKIVFERRN